MFQPKQIHRLIRMIIVTMFVIAFSGELFADERMKAFDRNVAAILLEKTLQQKLVAKEFKNDGTTFTITKLNRFKMDWETSQFMLDCSFRAGYHKGFINLEQAGDVSFSGAGVIAAEEQKLGVKLNRVNELRLDKMNEVMNNTITKVLDKSLSGRVFWPDTTASNYVVLTKDNLDTLIQVALNRMMPQTVNSEHTRVTLNKIQKLIFTDEPGGMIAAFDFEGKYDSLINFSFDGRVGVALQVAVDPEVLGGIIRIDRVTDLSLDQTAAFLDGIIKRMVNAKLQGSEVRFSWR